MIGHGVMARIVTRCGIASLRCFARWRRTGPAVADDVLAAFEDVGRYAGATVNVQVRRGDSDRDLELERDLRGAAPTGGVATCWRIEAIARMGWISVSRPPFLG
jgi:hypothetical protein